MRGSISLSWKTGWGGRWWLLTLCMGLLGGSVLASGSARGVTDTNLPPFLQAYTNALHVYADSQMTNAAGGLLVGEVLKNRIEKAPFNLIATLLFLGAVIHTFLTHKFRHMAHVLEERHKAVHDPLPGQNPIKKAARLLHFLGEVEAVFGIWAVPLLALLALDHGMQASVDYLNSRSYAEPIFVVVIMAISATRPVLNLAEGLMRRIAALGGGTVLAWWFSILTLGPLLGSFITEPAAMTISALLLSRQFYRLKPKPRFAYATLGLLFVNVSVGGTLTHFAAPPVLMVAGAWQWNTPFMATHFGWVATSGILLSNLLYFVVFRKNFAALQASIEALGYQEGTASQRTPVWVTVGHLLFMGAAVAWAHDPALLIGSFLFFLAFFEITEDYQGAFQLRSPILVGFFLAGLVTHGGLQQWWIAPVLGSLNEIPLMFGGIILTAFNDNAAITYLSTLVPGLTDSMKQAIVQGAVIGGGLTVIANAPNPAGQSILNNHFEDGISPIGLLLGALLPTVVQIVCFLTLGQLN